MKRKKQRRDEPPRFIDQRAKRLAHRGNALAGVAVLVALFLVAALLGSRFAMSTVHYGLAALIVVLAGCAMLCRVLAVPVDKQGRRFREAEQARYDAALLAANQRALAVPVVAPPDEPEWVEPPLARMPRPDGLRAELITTPELLVAALAEDGA